MTGLLFPKFDQLYPNMIGLDQITDMLHAATKDIAKSVPTYPPYNIKQIKDNKFVIEMAVAGFAKSELRVELHNNQLTIEGSKQSSDEGSNSGYVYRGIAGRQFRQTFALADHVKVIGSELRDGILTVELERDLPAEKKPRQIEIK